MKLRSIVLAAFLPLLFWWQPGSHHHRWPPPQPTPTATVSPSPTVSPTATSTPPGSQLGNALANGYATCLYWGCNMGGGSTSEFVAADVALNGGELDLTATNPNTSGMVSTFGHFSFLYGTVSARVEIPAGAGLWPALWLLPNTHQDASNEIDIMEILGAQPTKDYMTDHACSGGQQQGTYAGPDFSAGFHTFGLIWTGTSLTWTVDGVARFALSGSCVPHTAMYVIADLAVGGNSSWGGAPNGSTVFPAVMQVQDVTVTP